MIKHADDHQGQSTIANTVNADNNLNTSSQSPRISYTIEMLQSHNVEYQLKNEVTGHFHCYRKSDGKLFQFYANTGKIVGVTDAKGIHALINILDDLNK